MKPWWTVENGRKDRPIVLGKLKRNSGNILQICANDVNTIISGQNTLLMEKIRIGIVDLKLEVEPQDAVKRVNHFGLTSPRVKGLQSGINITAG